MNLNRRRFLTGVGVTGIAGLAGCAGSDGGDDGGDGGGEGDGGGGDDGGDGGDGGGGDASPTPKPVHVGMVYALGGLGDKSFNDMAHRGIQTAAEDFDAEFQNAEPSGPGDFKTLQRRYAQETNPAYDLVCCIGFAQTSALKENARQFSDQRFMIVDSVVEQDNVASYVFQEHKGSFQVGHLAGLLTTREFSAGGGATASDSTNVGFVGGKEIDLIKRFEAGFRAGVKHGNEDVDVSTAYAGDWSDPAKGKEIALSMYDSGADIVYHAAGGTGIGVFRAAQEQGRYAIGVDAEQSRSAPEFADIILASMVKRVDTAVYTSVENVASGSYTGGEVNSLGLDEDGVAAVLGQDLGPEIPEDVKSALEKSRQAIINGEIEVPRHPDEL